MLTPVAVTLRFTMRRYFPGYSRRAPIGARSHARLSLLTTDTSLKRQVACAEIHRNSEIDLVKTGAGQSGKRRRHANIIDEDLYLRDMGFLNLAEPVCSVRGPRSPST